MNDIVDQLRILAEMSRKVEVYDIANLFEEAAATIEQLRQELEVLLAEIKPGSRVNG